jgi:hypothetical protein
MKCDELEAALIDDLRRTLAADAKRDLDAHLAACERCSAEVESLREVWRSIGELPQAEVRAASRIRLEDTIRAFEAGRDDARPARSRSFGSRLLTAAAAVLQLSVGVAAGFMMSQSGGGADGGERYLLLVYVPPSFEATLSPAERAHLHEQYASWGKELYERRQLVDWFSVAPDGGRLVLAPGDTEEIDAPRLQDEALSWIVVIRAADLTDAARIARGCPALAAGARIEIRLDADGREKSPGGPA